MTAAGSGTVAGPVVKCVVWDLDGTVWPGTALESADAEGPDGTDPGTDDTAGLTPFPEALRAMDLLEQRGIVNSVASRTAPEIAGTVAARPELADRFVAPQIGWDHKSESVARIAGELGIDLAAVVLVDDSPFERAEVAAVLPQVRTLAPHELYARLDDPSLRPGAVTPDARARVGRYRLEEQRRTAEAEFAGPREEFLRGCDIRLAVRPARTADLDRMAELAERTHRFNTTGEAWRSARLAAVLDDPGWFVGVAELADRFGEYGLVGLALCQREPAPAQPADGAGLSAWLLHLLAVSCRAAGRDVPAGLLRWVLARAAADGATALRVPVRPTGANLQLRVLLRSAGFTPPATGGQPLLSDGELLTLSRSTAAELPAVPWLRMVEPQPVEEELRRLVAEVAGLDPAGAAGLGPDTPLLAGGLGLSSLHGARLLVEVRDRFGVDVAAEDLGLACLESLATLTAFVRARHTPDRATG